MTSQRLVHVTTVPQTLFFLRGQPAFFRSHGFEVHAVSSPGVELRAFGEEEGVRCHAIAMRRAISPVSDLIAIFRLWRLFRSLRPQIVHAHTPKGGLLAMIAATLAGGSLRIYHIHGLPLVTSRGVRKLLLAWAERLSCKLAHRVLCVSRSVMTLAIAESLVQAVDIEVLRHGSINGVDAGGRFRRSDRVLHEAAEVRRRWGIPTSAQVVGFVGRLVKDKGIIELAKAWTVCRLMFPDAHLLIVGPEEAHDPLPAKVLADLRADARVHLLGQDWDTPRFFASMDVLALPTHREGFVVTALEAAAMELPVVGTSVPGCLDAIVDGETGTLVPARDSSALADAIVAYLGDASLRRRHGASGRARALRDYRPDLLWDSLLAVYVTGLQRSAGSHNANSLFDVAAAKPPL